MTVLFFVKKRNSGTLHIFYGEVQFIRTDVIKTGKSVREEILAPHFQTPKGKK